MFLGNLAYANNPKIALLWNQKCASIFNLSQLYEELGITDKKMFENTLIYSLIHFPKTSDKLNCKQVLKNQMNSILLSNSISNTPITSTIKKKSPNSNQAIFTIPDPQIQVQKNPHRIGIFIGIQEYKNVPKALYASNDVNKFYDFADQTLGIIPENMYVLMDDDADKGAIKETFLFWLNSKIIENKSEVFVFYAGHGLRDEQGESYILPNNTRVRLLKDTAIAMQEIIDIVDNFQPASATFFMDSCYGGIGRGNIQLTDARPIMLVEKNIKLPDNFTLFTATENNQWATGIQEVQHGVFSYFVMKGLEGAANSDNDNKITYAELYDYLQKNIPLHTARKQTPSIRGNNIGVLTQW